MLPGLFYACITIVILPQSGHGTCLLCAQPSRRGAVRGGAAFWNGLSPGAARPLQRLRSPRPRRGADLAPCSPRKRRSRQDAVCALLKTGKARLAALLRPAKKRQRHRPAAAGAEKPVQMILLFDAGRQALLCLPFLWALFVVPGREMRAGPRQRGRCEKNRGKSGKTRRPAPVPQLKKGINTAAGRCCVLRRILLY